MIAGQQQLCCDAAERAEGAVAWVQGTVNVGALGGVDASGLGFRQELDPGAKDTPPHTQQRQLGSRQGHCRARVCGEARPRPGGGEPEGASTCGERAAEPVLPAVDSRVGLPVSKKVATTRPGSFHVNPQEPVASLARPPGSRVAPRWLQVSTSKGQPSRPWNPTRLLSSIAPDGGTSPPWPPGGTSGLSATVNHR